MLRDGRRGLKQAPISHLQLTLPGLALCAPAKLAGYLPTPLLAQQCLFPLPRPRTFLSLPSDITF